eukprot:2737245-Amphidinium_carterae.1
MTAAATSHHHSGKEKFCLEHNTALNSKSLSATCMVFSSRTTFPRASNARVGIERFSNSHRCASFVPLSSSHACRVGFHKLPFTLLEACTLSPTRASHGTHG